MKKTTIYVVRHGQSEGNAKQLFLGHTDLDITELGYKQADATAKALKDLKLDAIYSSDLKRAYNTAIPHAKIRNMEIITDKGFREFNVGGWEGKHVDEIIEKYGNMFADEWHGGFGTFTFPDGECVMDGGRRFYNTLKTIAKDNPGRTILVAAHAGVIRSFWSIISGIAPENIVSELPFPSNASYSVCEYYNDEIYPVEYSHDEHLSEVGITRVIPLKR